MLLNKLGVSDLKVSQLCLGTMTFGYPTGKQKALGLVHWAIDQGINFFDTADIYEGYSRYPGSAGGTAEKLLGNALIGKRNNAIITSKVGNLVGGDYVGEGLSKKHIEHQVNKSLKNLKTDYIDIYEMHKPDPNTLLAESISAFINLKKIGKIRYWGISNFNPDQVNELICVCNENGWELPIVCQSHYSWMNRRLEKDLFPLLKENNIALTPYRILEGGLLTNKYVQGDKFDERSRLVEHPSWTSNSDSFSQKRLAEFVIEAGNLRLEPIVYAIKWLLDKPNIPSVLIGAKKPSQIVPYLSFLSREYA